eukprot:974908-Rhodomonas_salina.1
MPGACSMSGICQRTRARTRAFSAGECAFVCDECALSAGASALPAQPSFPAPPVGSAPACAPQRGEP